MKIKSNCIADFFNLMGVEAIDPMSCRKADPKLRAHPFARNSANKNSSNKNEPSAPGLSPEDVRLGKGVEVFLHVLNHATEVRSGLFHIIL